MKKRQYHRTQLVTLRIPKALIKEVDLLAIGAEKYRTEIIVEAITEHIRREASHCEASRRAQQST